MNTFTIDTDIYYPRCYKVNDAKTCKILVVSFYALCSQIICICRLACLTGTFENHVNLILCIIRSDQKDIKLYVLDPFHFQRAKQAFKIKPVTIPVKINQDVSKRTSADMELNNHPKP